MYCLANGNCNIIFVFRFWGFIPTNIYITLAQVILFDLEKCWLVCTEVLSVCNLSSVYPYCFKKIFKRISSVKSYISFWYIFSFLSLYLYYKHKEILTKIKNRKISSCEDHLNSVLTQDCPIRTSFPLWVILMMVLLIITDILSSRIYVILEA